MLTFTHLPTFRGAPPDGVWHQHLHGARYVKGGVAANVRSNGFVYVSAPPPAAPLRHTHCCKTIDTAFAAAEAEVKVQDEFVRGVAMFEELRRRRLEEDQHEAMAAVLAAAYPVDRPVAYIGPKEPRPNGWSMRVDRPGVWGFAVGGLLRASVRVTPGGGYAAFGGEHASFAAAADAVEGVVPKPKAAPESDYAPVTSISDLKSGDLIRHRSSGTSYTVTANYGSRVTAVATADVTNPSEWLVWREK